MSLVDKSYSFYVDNINDGKLDLLKKKAEVLRDFKNDISKKICTNYKKHISSSKFDWINKFRTKHPFCNNQDISNAIEDVYVAYENKRNSFKKKTTIKVQDGVTINRYKKSGKKFNKGDIKEYNIKFKSTPLTKVVSFLTRYWNEGLIEHLKKEEGKERNLLQFHKMVLGYIDKFGERLVDLAKNKQNRIEKKLFEHPIIFERLTFTSCAEQKQNIINKNPRTTSKYNAYIILPGQKTSDGKIVLPTKHSKKHHGSLRHYHKKPNMKGTRKQSYKIKFENGKVRVILTRKKEEREISGKWNIYGLDVNVKHNLFCDKNNNQVHYDSKMFKGYIHFMKEMDKKLERKRKVGEGKLGNKDKIKKEKWELRIQNMLKFKCNELVKNAILLGRDHIVMEDLEQVMKGFSRSLELEGFKVTRLCRLLNLGSLKHIIRSIANKKGIQVTFVQSHYTSQTCNKCGHISKENRKTQETFKCISCGYETNADAHAAKMIEDRINEDVLRKSLLKEKNGIFEPKKMKKSSIKSILSACYDSKTSKGGLNIFPMQNVKKQ